MTSSKQEEKPEAAEHQAAAPAPAPAHEPLADSVTGSKRIYKMMTPAERDMALRLVAGGASKSDAARVLGVARSTLSTNIKRLREQAHSDASTPPLMRGKGRPPVLTETALARIRAWADDHKQAPSAAAAGAKNPRQLTAFVRSEFGLAVSEATVRRVLHEYAEATAEAFDGVLLFRDGGVSLAKLERLFRSAKRTIRLSMRVFTCWTVRSFVAVVVGANLVGSVQYVAHHAALWAVSRGRGRC